MERRHWILAGTGGLGALALGRIAAGRQWSIAARQVSDAAPAHFEVEHTDAQWRALLTPQQYAVLRREATEYAFSSPLDHETRPGTYSCAGCALALFSSTTKYDSETGWPSFWQPLEGAVGTNRDTTLGMVRNEVHCTRCGGHLGHVFDDGPPPTGLRYCINGVALRFEPAGGKS